MNAYPPTLTTTPNNNDRSTTARTGQDLAVIEQLLDLGRRDLARSTCRRLLDSANDTVLTELAELAAASERSRANTSVPSHETGGYRPSSAPHVRQRPPRAPSPRGRRMGQARTDGQAMIDAYLAERGDLDDQPATVEAPPDYSLDYDLAAMPALRDTCLNCRLERPRAEQTRPDGLCAECVEAGHTRTSVIQSCCANIAATAGTNALELLRRAWRRANPRDRAVIANWVDNHPELLTASTPPFKHARELTFSGQPHGHRFTTNEDGGEWPNHARGAAGPPRHGHLGAGPPRRDRVDGGPHHRAPTPAAGPHRHAHADAADHRHTAPPAVRGPRPRDRATDSPPSPLPPIVLRRARTLTPSPDKNGPLHRADVCRHRRRPNPCPRAASPAGAAAARARRSPVELTSFSLPRTPPWVGAGCRRPKVSTTGEHLGDEPAPIHPGETAGRYPARRLRRTRSRPG